MPKVTAAHQEARRRQIIDAATECFVREGFHRTSMQDVVRESGLSPGAIYGYFRSKEDIISAVANERHRTETALIHEAFESATDARTALHRIGRAYLAWLDEPAERHRRQLGVQVWAEALRDPSILAIVKRGVDQRAAAIEPLRQAQARGELHADLDPDTLSRVLLALLQGFILQQAWDPEVDTDAFAAAVDTIIDAITLPSH